MDPYMFLDLASGGLANTTIPSYSSWKFSLPEHWSNYSSVTIRDLNIAYNYLCKFIKLSTVRVDQLGGWYNLISSFTIVFSGMYILLFFLSHWIDNCRLQRENQILKDTLDSAKQTNSRLKDTLDKQTADYNGLLELCKEFKEKRNSVNTSNTDPVVNLSNNKTVYVDFARLVQNKKLNYCDELLIGYYNFLEAYYPDFQDMRKSDKNDETILQAINRFQNRYSELTCSSIQMLGDNSDDNYITMPMFNFILYYFDLDIKENISVNVYGKRKGLLSSHIDETSVFLMTKRNRTEVKIYDLINTNDLENMKTYNFVSTTPLYSFTNPNEKFMMSYK